MAPARRNPSPSEDNSGSDDTFNEKRPDYGDVMKNIAKLKAQRTEARKKIIKDQEEDLAKIKGHIEKAHQESREFLATLKSNRLQRLHKAIEKKSACEKAILDQIMTLNKDREHFSLLIDAVYKARVESAEDLRADASTSRSM